MQFAHNVRVPSMHAKASLPKQCSYVTDDRASFQYVSFGKVGEFIAV